MLRLRDLQLPALAALLLLICVRFLADDSIAEDELLERQHSLALSLLSRAELEQPSLRGFIEVYPSGDRLRDTDLLRSFAAGAPLSTTYTYHVAGLTNVTATAMGVDHHHYVVNAYLEGYKPFPVQDPWTPWYVIAKHKRYMYDHVQYAGRSEVWQTSRQSFHAPRGDCEDHAILLADWLIAAGYDAWVALGHNRGEGHAWVVLFDDGVEYLLEATQKDGLRQVKHLPLAALQTDYRPAMRFNRDEFYFNTGAEFTTSYRSAQWSKRSRFFRDRI